MRTIVVPVDFSPNSDSACNYAIEIAKRTGAKIILMYAFESALLYSKIPLTTMQLDYSFLFNGAAKKLQTFRKKIERHAKGVEIELSVQQGLPSSRVTELAMEKKADLIVIGSTGKGKVERIMFGSNAIRTIKHAPCMVLVVPPKATFNGFRKIAYATDLTKDNLAHANKLLPLANLFKSELVFLNISEDADLKSKQLKAVEEKIHKTVNYKIVSGIISVDFDTVRGVNFSAKSQKVDCIAVYTRHHDLVNRIFGTSIASSLSLHIEMPLLVLHEDDYVAFAMEPEQEKKSKIKK